MLTQHFLPISFHACAPISELPPNISTMYSRVLSAFILILNHRAILCFEYFVSTVHAMVLILDGNSEIGAHVLGQIVKKGE